MFPSFLLSLREGLEAALILGITLAVLNKIKRNDLKKPVWYGAVAAIIFSLVAGALLFWLGADLEGRPEEIFEGFAMLFAAGLLTWMILWLQTRSFNLRQELETDTHRAAIQGGKKALFMLAFLAIGREGFELAIFLFATNAASNALATLIGALSGLALAVFLGWLLFTTTRRLNIKAFFQVTSVLLILFAAGLTAHGIHELIEAGIVPPIIEHVWDINHLMDENSPLGGILKAVFGYNGNPSLTEVLAYLSYFGLLWYGMQKITAPTQKTQEV
jgi:high-affinity iron transporter